MKDLGKGIGEALVGAFRERRGGGRRVREDRQARRARSRHLDDRRLRPALGAEVPASAPLSPRSPARSGRGLFGGACRSARWRPPSATPAAWPAPGRSGSSRRRPSAGRRGCTPDARRWLRADEVRDDPAARRAGAQPAGDRGLRAGALRRRRRSSTSTPATPRASGSRAPRSPPTSPARSRSAGGGSVSHGVPRRPLPRRHQPRRARRPGAAHADRRARLGRRGAQRLLGELAPALRRRLRHPPRRRSRRGRRLLRGAQRPAARLPLQGLGRLQVLPAVGAPSRRSTSRSAPATARRPRSSCVKRYASGAQTWTRHDHQAGRRHRAGRARRRAQALRLVGRRAAPGSSPSPRRPAPASRSPPASSSTCRCASTPTGSTSPSTSSGSARSPRSRSWRCGDEDALAPRCRRISTAARRRSPGAGASSAPTASSSASPTTTGRSLRRRHLRARVRLHRLGDPQRHRSRGRRAGRRGRADLGHHHRDRHPRRPLGQCRGRGLAGELERGRRSAC